MPLFDVIAILLALTALCSYLNHRFLRLHGGTGVMIISLLLSLLLIALQALGVELHEQVSRFLGEIKFDAALLNWMLGFLLFAGALTLDLEELNRQRGAIAALAVVSTLVSMFLFAGLLWIILREIGSPMDWLHCLLLGALISPTDPVAVLNLIKRMRGPKRVETIIAGEALFNDGVGVVLFLTILNLINQGGHVSPVAVTTQFIRVCVGGIALGLFGGILVYFLIRQVRDFSLDVLITLSLVMGIFASAQWLGVSGPIAVVAAGMLLGNSGRFLKMPTEAVENLNHFWELIDEVLNTVLFVLIGMELLITRFPPSMILVAVMGIPLALLARWLSVATAMIPLRWHDKTRGAMIAILTWGGLRGGLAIAMALSIPHDSLGLRDRILAITYGVVAFSLLVQATTMRRFMLAIP